MRTFKLIGSGPLSGVVSYCTIQHIDILSRDGVVLVLDEAQWLGTHPFSVVTVSAITGAVKLPGRGETDLMRLDPADLPRLQEAFTLWMDRLPSPILNP